MGRYSGGFAIEETDMARRALAETLRRHPLGMVAGGAWLATFTLAAGWLAPELGARFEGVDPALGSRLPLAATVLGFVSSLVATGLWARGLYRSAVSAAARPGRRRFLVGAAAGAAGMAGTAAAAILPISGWALRTGPALRPRVPTESDAPQEQWAGARVREYRRLGRTEARVSDISLGSSRISPERGGEEIARLAIERGVNYFDTAPDYADAGSEIALGRAMQGQRDRLFVATKFCTPQGHLPEGSPVADYVRVIEESLRRLRTDHVDLVHVHACDDVGRLLDPNAHEAFDRLKQQGKARFLGVSTHTPRLERVARAAIESGRFDVMMLAYHHGAWPALGRIIEEAAARDVGIVAMKTLKGARHQGLLDSHAERDSYPQAAFRWVLSNPRVSCLVISFSKLRHVDEYLYASGGRPSERELALLRKYDERSAGVHCFQHCGACLDACPEQLRIDDVLRHRMYFEDYGDQKEAMRLYARLPRHAERCLGCPAPCTGACPHGVPIQQRMIGAHAMLAPERDARLQTHG
jgi:hypothetical protein